MLSSEILPVLKAQLLAMEGYRQFPYKDTAGKLTIGIGRNIQDVGISMQEAQFLLDDDITKCQTMLAAALQCFNELDEVRQMCLVNMCFNLGIDKFLEFKEMIECLNNHDYQGAAKAMLSSLWYQELSQRVTILSNMMASGEIKA